MQVNGKFIFALKASIDHVISADGRNLKMAVADEMDSVTPFQTPGTIVPISNEILHYSVMTCIFHRYDTHQICSLSARSAEFDIFERICLWLVCCNLIHSWIPFLA
jgi:hypothetical protein